jgi:hypothetical protein
MADVNFRAGELRVLDKVVLPVRKRRRAKDKKRGQEQLARERGDVADELKEYE